MSRSGRTGTGTQNRQCRVVIGDQSVSNVIKLVPFWLVFTLQEIFLSRVTFIPQFSRLTW